MATVYTRAGKGSALTWTEADANITNLNTAKLENIVEDTSPQLGGWLDVNGQIITNTLAGSSTTKIDITTKDIILTPGNPTIGTAGRVAINNQYFLTNSDGTNGQVLATDGAGSVTFTTINTDVVYDTTPQLGGALDVNGKDITSASNGNVTIAPNGSGNINLTPATGKIIVGALEFPTGAGTNGQVLTTNGSTAMTWSTVSAGATTLDGLTDVVITAAATNDVLVYNGTNWVDTALSGVTVGTASVASTVTLTADNTTAATNYPLFANAATGNLSPRTDTGFTYNPSSGTLTAAGFSGPLSGTATSATNINISSIDGNASDTTLYPVFVGLSSTGNQAPHIDSSSISFNGSTGILTSTGFSGAINGTVGASTPSTGAFTSITASGAITASGSLNASSTTANSPKLQLGAGSLSSTAWTTSGIGIRAYTAIYTDTSSLAGTVAASHIHAIAAPTMASTNAITVTDAASLYVADGPTAGTNTTITNKWALLAGGNIKANAFTSSVATGTAPFTVASTTNVANLNASSLNGATFASPGSIGSTTPAAGTFTTLTATTTTLDDIRETVFALTYAATITPDAANGSVQTVTLTGNVTFSAFSNPVSGQTITLIITQDATGSRTLTSTMKFAGGSKTLTTTANAIDILTVSYIGTTYYASLSKGFA